jgi:two-component system, chemotaxis family, response regulator Rcp1
VAYCRPQVLLVEDNPGDVRLFQEALRCAHLEYDLRGAADGAEAMALLHPPAPLPAWKPDLIILDLNLPRMSGRELLANIHCCPEHRDVPLVVLTSSTAEREVLHDVGVLPEAYFVKPDGFSGLVQVVKDIEGIRWRGQCPEGITHE